MVAGCVKDPSASNFVAPKLGDITADIEPFRIKLSCHISGDPATISASGFYFGTSKAEMKYYEVKANGQDLKLEMKALEHSTDYYAYAVIGNGNSEIRTEQVCLTTKAGEEILEFEDDVFKRYVLAGYDKNSDGVVTLTEASKITEIHVHTDSIVSLKGIEKMPELVILDAEGKFDFEVGEAKGILASIDVSHNPKLTVLNLGENKLKHLDVTNNPSLVQIGLNNNLLTSFPYFLHLSNLREIHLSSIAEMLADSDFLTHFPLLEGLNICGYRGKTMDFSKTPLLRWVWCCYMPNVETIDLSACPNIERLEAVDNHSLKQIILHRSAHPEILLKDDGVEVVYK